MDTFGKITSGRVADGGRFNAIPAANVPASAIFMPAYSASPLFGVAEYPVAAGEQGAFATSGVFAFDKPSGWTSSVGQAVYNKPTAAAAGTLSASSSAGAVKIGYEITVNADDKLLVYLTPPTALESGT